MTAPGAAVGDLAVPVPDGQASPDAPAEQTSGDGPGIGRESLAALSSCGVFGGAAFLGCFPLVTVAVIVALWWVPVTKLLRWGRPPAIDLLDELVEAEERWATAHDGAWVPASACPVDLPAGEPVAFPGGCGAPWTDLDLPWQTLDCRMAVAPLGGGGLVATAECGDETWQATATRGPHRIEPGE